MAQILSLQIFKKRPVMATGIVVVGGLIVYLLFFRGGAEAGSSESYTDSQVNTASGLSAAQSQSHARAQEIQGQLAMAQIQSSTQLQTVAAQANLQRDIAAFSFEAARLDHARDMYGLGVQERIETLGLQTSAQIEQLRISSELEALQSQQETQLMMQQIMTQGNVSLAAQAAQVSIAGIKAQENVARYSMDTTSKLAEIQSHTLIETTRLTTGSQTAIAKSGSSASKASTWAGAAIAIASLFCDRYIKTIDGCVDENACAKAIREMPVEMWRYLQGSVGDDGGKYHFNTYSQDFYRTLGAPDWSERKQIEIVDYLGALTGAFKALDRKVSQ